MYYTYSVCVGGALFSLTSLFSLLYSQKYTLFLSLLQTQPYFFQIHQLDYAEIFVFAYYFLCIIP